MTTCRCRLRPPAQLRCSQLAASSSPAPPASTSGHILNHTSGVRTPVSAPSATSSPAAARYTYAWASAARLAVAAGRS